MEIKIPFWSPLKPACEGGGPEGAGHRLQSVAILSKGPAEHEKETPLLQRDIATY